MTFSKFALLLIILSSLVLIGGCSEDCEETTIIVPEAPPELAFAGSDICATCHAEKHDLWTHSGHPYKLTKIEDGPPLGAFPDPSAYADNSIDPPGGTPWSDYSYTIGGYGWKMRWIKNDGFIYTPGGGGNQFNFENESWTDYNAGASKPYNCGACHTTGWEDSDDGNADNNQDGMPGFLGTFFAGGVHCEKCHGMGTRHAYSPTTYAMETDDTSYFCGKCHSRGGDNGVSPGEKIIEASGWVDGVIGGSTFIQHHEQYDEWYNSPHNSTYGPGCNACHDPHASVKFDTDEDGNQLAPGEGVSTTTTCVSCHVEGAHANIAEVNHDFATCVDCHMPDASKSAIANNVHDGDVSTHLWIINTSINGKADMFNAEGKAVVIDDNGHGAVTLDYACYGCHRDENGVGGTRSIKTMQELVDKAVNIHTLVVPTLVSN